jgi:hypothetical protein
MTHDHDTNQEADMSVHAVEPTPPQDSPSDETTVSGIDSLTAGETAAAERKAALSITTLGDNHFPQVGLLGALGWMLMRRKDPKLTYERYMAENTVEQITNDLSLSDDAEVDEGKDDAALT